MDALVWLADRPEGLSLSPLDPPPKTHAGRPRHDSHALFGAYADSRKLAKTALAYLEVCAFVLCVCVKGGRGVRVCARTCWLFFYYSAGFVCAL